MGADAADGKRKGELVILTSRQAIPTAQGRVFAPVARGWGLKRPYEPVKALLKWFSAVRYELNFRFLKWFQLGSEVTHA
jgi:hypothetical protein